MGRGRDSDPLRYRRGLQRRSYICRRSIHVPALYSINTISTDLLKYIGERVWREGGIGLYKMGNRDGSCLCTTV